MPVGEHPGANAQHGGRGCAGAELDSVLPPHTDLSGVLPHGVFSKVGPGGLFLQSSLGQRSWLGVQDIMEALSSCERGVTVSLWGVTPEWEGERNGLRD